MTKEEINRIGEMQKEWRSDRLPDYDDSLFYKCQKIMFDLKINDLLFVGSTFPQNPNNKAGSFWQFLTDLDSHYQLNGDISLGLLDMLFKNGQLQKDYEGVYNSLNFVKNTIYRKMQHGHKSECDSLSLLQSFKINKKYINEHLGMKNVCFHLDQVRSGIPDCRSSISNGSIFRGKNKIGKSVTIAQDFLTDAVAFSTFYSELEKEEYKAAERLLYVPNEKIKVKSYRY